MLPSTTKIKSSQANISTAEAFYRVFCALSKKDRLNVARYILNDEEIQQQYELSKIPNNVTLNAFAEDKANMPTFESIQELREDLFR